VVIDHRLSRALGPDGDGAEGGGRTAPGPGGQIFSRPSQ